MRGRRSFCAASARCLQAFLGERIPADRAQAQRALEQLFSVNFYALPLGELVDALDRVGRVASAHRGEDKASKLACKLIPALLSRAGDGLPAAAAARLLAASLRLRVFNAALFALIARALRAQRQVALAPPLIGSLQTLLFFHAESADCLELFDWLAARADWAAARALPPLAALGLAQCLLVREIARRVAVEQRQSSVEALLGAAAPTAQLQPLQAALLRARDAALRAHPALPELLESLSPRAELGKLFLASYLKLAPLLFPELLPRLGRGDWRSSELLITPALGLTRFFAGEGRRLLELALAALPLARKMADFALHRRDGADFVRCFADRTTKIDCNEQLFARLLHARAAAPVERNALRYIYEVDLLVDGRHALEVDSQAHAFFVLARAGERPTTRPSATRALPRLLTLAFFGVQRQFSFLPAECYRRARATGQFRPEEHVHENVLRLRG